MPRRPSRTSNLSWLYALALVTALLAVSRTAHAQTPPVNQAPTFTAMATTRSVAENPNVSGLCASLPSGQIDPAAKNHAFISTLLAAHGQLPVQDRRWQCPPVAGIAGGTP